MNAPDLTQGNPLLTDDGALPAYARIRPEHIAPAIATLLADAAAALEHTVSDAVAPEWAAIERALDVPTERLGNAWGAVTHLTEVADTPELRAAHAAQLPRVVAHYTAQGSDERLYAKYRALAEGPHAAALTPTQTHVLAHALRDFRLGGADLQGEAKARYAAIQDRLAELGKAFGDHALDATDAFAYFADGDELAGLPADLLAAGRAAAQADGQAGVKLTLKAPSYLPVMQHGAHRPLRERLYRAYVTRASEFGPPEWDNSAVMAEILALRQEEAQLLGFANYAELSLQTKMAAGPAQVRAFLQELAAKARPAAERDWAELQAYARDELGLPELQAWDVAFASERLKEARYAFSDDEVKAYLPLPKVLAGLFDIIQRVFGVQVVASESPAWHDSVGYYHLQRGGQTVAAFYLDPYARSGKQSGAWVDAARNRWLRADSGSLQTPVAHVVCNSAPPVGGAPARLTHDNLITLFHEFGHALHHMLTRVDTLGASGMSGVEWDAVELPSQFMENYCWEWEVMRTLTEHMDTGQAMPRALFDKLLAAKNFQSGLQTLRQLEFGLFDLRIHSEPDAAGRVLAVLDEVRREVAVWQPPAFNRMPHTFSHIFGGGYAAGYYSYKWAEVLSADAWSAFEETGPLNPDTGARFAREVLEVGGSRPALASFIAFRGREPQVDALLRHSGLAPAHASR